MRAITGHSPEYIWHKMSIVEANDYRLIYWREKIQEVERFDVLMGCLSKGSDPRKLETVRMDAARRQNLV